MAKTEVSASAHHAQMVHDLVKDPELIIETLTAEKMDMLHAAVGIAGEAGELLDAVKKCVVYNKPLDRENVIEELGDLEFYMQALRARLQISRDLTLDCNMAKLQKGKNARYANGYTDEAAQARADKAVAA